MATKLRKVTSGFTLIELLVVIAIIGLLASIVMVSLSTARRKARDSRRVGDLRQVQLALEMYFDANAEYPFSAAPGSGTPYDLDTANTAFNAGSLAPALVPTYLGGMPDDPLDTGAGADYRYGYAPGDGTSPNPLNCNELLDTCLRYLLIAMLEETTNPALDNDNDAANGGFAANNGYPCDASEAAAPATYCVRA